MRCKGKTKSGARCKRNAPEGAEYCATHVDQSASDGAETPEPATDDIFGSDENPTSGDNSESAGDEWWDALVEVATVGAIVVVALALGRVIRVL